MSTYHRSDKEEWDEMMDERREVRRHHYDDYSDDSEFWDIFDEELREGNSLVVAVSSSIAASSGDAWFWDDGREVDPELNDRYNVHRKRESRNGEDW